MVDRQVGRPRSFEDDAVLEAAATCFWARGYRAASVRDLSECMGIAGASLYNAYGGKRALYAAALDHYCKRSMRERIRRLESGSRGLSAIEAFFHDVVERSLSDEDRKGCFLVNASLEIAPHDQRLAEAVSGYFLELKSFFRRNIVVAQELGQVATSVDPARYAMHLLCVLMGIRVLARCNPDRSHLEAAVASAIEGLRPGPVPKLKDLS
jgi:TetR/AcrR family transcriptional repressor of nem operon